MARSSSRTRWHNVPTVLAEFVNRSGWSPVALLNRIDRWTPGLNRARQLADGLRYGPDERHRLDVWAPPERRQADAEATLRPVIVFFYGGGWHSGERADYGFAAAAFASEDFVVVVPDYRLVPTTRYPGFIEDGAAALRWVVKNIAAFGGDPARIVLSGHSAGAYIAAMLALDERWLKAAGVDRAIIRASVLLSGPYDFAPFRERRGRIAFGDWPDPAATQPVSHARRDIAPMLLVHGSGDRIVFAKNSRTLAARLAEAGAPVALRIFPGANHADPVVALSRPFRGRLPVLAEAVAFLRDALAAPTSAGKTGS